MTTRTSRTAKPPAALGPNQLADRLGLAQWQRERALASGDIPQPDQAGGKWSATVVDALAGRAAEIRANAGTLPDIGADRAAGHLGERLGIDITGDAIRELRRSGKLIPVGSYKNHRLYDGRIIAAWTDVEALIEAERVGRLVTAEVMTAKLDIRRVDFAHLLRIGVLRPRRHVSGQWGSRVALYRTGDADALLASTAIDWAAVRATPKGRLSILAQLPSVTR